MVRINGLHIASQSWPLFFIVGIGMLTQFVGCSGEISGTPEKRIEQNLADKLAEIPDVLANGSVKGFVDSVVSNTSLFSSTEKQAEWYRKALDEVFSVDISRFSYRCQYRSFCLIEDLWSGISVGLSKVTEKTWIELWQLRLNDLAWKQQQLERLKGEYSVLAPSANVRPIPFSVLKKERGLKSTIECMQTDMPGEIDRYERWYWEERSQMSREEHRKIGDMLVATLKRPLRSLEQIEADRQKMAEAWRRAEEANRRQRERDRESNAKMDINAL